MSIEVFTQRWAQAWADELRESETYRRAALQWEGSLMIEMAADPENGIGDDRAVFLDLWHGDCRGARLPDDDDRRGADFVIRATAGDWKRILAGEVEPIFGLMSGKLKLARGNLARLLPFANAAKELVAAGARIESHFPGDNGADGSADGSAGT